MTTNKGIKIKAAMKLYYNPDPSMEAVRLIKEKAVRGWRLLVIKEGSRYAEELGLHLKLEYHSSILLWMYSEGTQEMSEMLLKN